MFLKTYEMCDVVSLLIQQTDNSLFLVTGGPSPDVGKNPSKTRINLGSASLIAAAAGVGANAGAGGNNSSGSSANNSKTNLLRAAAQPYRLPSVKVHQDEWAHTALDLAANLLGRPFKVVLLKMFKIWMPGHAQKYLYHMVYLVNVLALELKKTKQRGPLYKWMSFDELVMAKSQNMLISPELLTLVTMVNNSTSLIGGNRDTIGQQEHFASNRELITEIVEKHIMPSMRNSNPGHLELLRSAEIERSGQMLLYRDFMLACFPYLYVNPSKFAIAVADQLPDWSYEDYMDLFRCADISNRGALSFTDYLNIFAICDINTPHVGRSAELRCHYIFRFFDRNGDGSLVLDEFKKLLIHVRKNRKRPFDEQTLEKDLEMYSVTLNVDQNHPLQKLSFMQAAGDLRLRGTGSVLRFTKTLREYLCGRGISDDRNTNKQGARNSITYSLRHLVSLDAARDTQQHTLALHTIKIGIVDNDIVIEQLWNRSDCASPSTIRMLNGNTKKLSIDTFNPKSPANDLIDFLQRYANSTNEQHPAAANSKRTPFSWCNINMQHVGLSLIAVAASARAILMAEKRMLDLASPVYVLGDLHGNFTDVMHFERMLWHLTPTLSPTNILCLGDYVDRGTSSVEVIAYLLAYKVMNPRKMFLIRGNHEIRDIQKSFTFHQECLDKFGEAIGLDVWTAVNNAFDVMPLAAVIDGRIFCCHGGIPPPWVCIDIGQQIERIPVPLPLPDQQSDLAWSLMWNDPIRPSDLNDETRKELDVRSGFMKNTRRGTGFVFNAEAFEAFLQHNNYTHMIRAHEMRQAGITVQFDGKLLTVFSSSRYCGSMNDAACVLVESTKMRIIRLHTRHRGSGAAPAAAGCAPANQSRP